MPTTSQRVEQVWLVGVHSNVGGGFEDKGLSSITVRWMIDRAKECDLTFDESYLERVIKPARDGRLYGSRHAEATETGPGWQSRGPAALRTALLMRSPPEPR